MGNRPFSERRIDSRRYWDKIEHSADLDRMLEEGPVRIVTSDNRMNRTEGWLVLIFFALVCNLIITILK